MAMVYSRIPFLLAPRQPKRVFTHCPTISRSGPLQSTSFSLANSCCLHADHYRVLAFFFQSSSFYNQTSLHDAYHATMQPVSKDSFQIRAWGILSLVQCGHAQQSTVPGILGCWFRLLTLSKNAVHISSYTLSIPFPCRASSSLVEID